MPSRHTRVSSDQPRAALRLWIAVLGPPLAFLVNLQTTYALVPVVCGQRDVPHAALHLVTLLLLALTVAAGVHGWRLLQASGEEWPGEEATPEDRSRLLALLGVLSAAFFGLILLAQWIPTLVLSACLAPS